jgi:hypothetical protein
MQNVEKDKKIFFLKTNKSKNKIFFFFKQIKKNILFKLNNKYFNLKKKKYLLKNIIKNLKKKIIFIYKKKNLDFFFFKYKKLNYLYKNFIYSNYYSFFYNNFKMYNNIFNFFLIYLYKKNKYIKYIFIHEGNVVAESIWNYPATTNNISYKYFYKTSNDLLKNIIKYFYIIDKNLFNYNSPNWLLHKNKSTFFFINTKKIENCSISVSYDFPFELDFFFICIIPQTILLNFFFFGQENEANIYEVNQQRQLI